MLPRVEVKRDDARLRLRAWVRRGARGAAVLCVFVALFCACRATAANDAGAPRSSVRPLPVDLGVGSGVALVSRGTSVQVFARGDSPDRVSSAEDLVDVITLLEPLRTHVLDEHAVHHCNGLNCTRVHGDITAARALATRCLHFFDDLAARIGPDSLATAFLTLGVQAPAIPADRDARVRLASRGDGWALSPRDALRLARGLRNRPEPWSDVLEEGLRPESPLATGLRGKLAGSGEISGWFVGYLEADDRALVDVRVSRCVSSCAERALAIAQWASQQRAPR
jgi:hypothetical protein